MSSALDGLAVVDLGAGQATTLVAQFLANAGAKVIRPTIPGADAAAGDCPAYPVWRSGDVATDETDPRKLAAAADIVIVGGEDYPGLTRTTPADVSGTPNKRLIVLDITGYPNGAGGPAHAAVEILVQARSGLVFEQFADRPIHMAFEPGIFGGALQALIGLLAALYEREGSGLGQTVSSSLYEGQATFGAFFWSEFERPTPDATFTIPKDPLPLVMRCKDGKYVHIVMGAAGSKAKLYRLLGLDDTGIDPADNGMGRVGGDVRTYFGEIDLFAGPIATFTRDEMLAGLWKAGIAADAVLAPGECWDEEQVKLGGVIQTAPDGSRHVGIPLTARWTPPAETPPRRRRPQGEGPLAGLRIIDLGAFVAGAYNTVLLADYGAEVIKVEPPGGDTNRLSYSSFTSANRGKRSIILDLKSPADRERLYALCRDADVVTNNFRAGVSERLGVDPKTLHAVAPHLIILESSAFGPTGPKARNAGFDPVIQAYTGVEFAAGGEGNDPLWNRTVAADYTAGLLGAAAILLAVYRRARTREGAELYTPLMNAGLYLTSNFVQGADGTFRGPAPLNADQTGRHPAACLYQASDRWLAVAALDDATAAALASELGVTAPGARAAWGEAERQAIAKAVAVCPAVTLVEALRGRGVFAEICDPDAFAQWLRHGALERHGVVWKARHPVFGAVRHFGPLARFDRTPPGPAAPAPELGEHTDQVLTAETA